MEDGVFALFFRPQPGEFDSSKVPAPGNLPSKAKKNANLWPLPYYTFSDTLQGKSGAPQPSWIVFVTVLFSSMYHFYL